MAQRRRVAAPAAAPAAALAGGCAARAPFPWEDCATCPVAADVFTLDVEGLAGGQVPRAPSIAACAQLAACAAIAWQRPSPGAAFICTGGSLRYHAWR